jgi:hypothetical protein
MGYILQVNKKLKAHNKRGKNAETATGCSNNTLSAAGKLHTGPELGSFHRAEL